MYGHLWPGFTWISEQINNIVITYYIYVPVLYTKEIRINIIIIIIKLCRSKETVAASWTFCIDVLY